MNWSQVRQREVSAVAFLRETVEVGQKGGCTFSGAFTFHVLPKESATTGKERNMKRKTIPQIAAVAFAVVGIGVATPAAATTTRYYRFETNNGVGVSNGQVMTSADDSSGNGLNGIVHGSPTYTTSPFGSTVPATGALNNFAFVGDSTIGEGIELDPENAPIFEPTFTLEFDFRFSSANPNTGDVKRLFHCQSVQDGSPSPLAIYLANLDGNGGTDDLECSFDSEAFALRAFDLNVNHNYDLALTYNGTIASLYLNGSLVQSSTYTGFQGSGSAIAAIGNDQYFNSPVFPGEIDEVRISDVALQPNQFLNVTTLTWNNTGDNGDGQTWDIGTNNNWQHGSAVTVYADGSNVIFNDANNGNYAVTLNTTVNPASVTVNNSNGNYTISGTGSIGGTTSLTKCGTGTLTLSTANTYSGGTIVNNGVLEIEPTSSKTCALPTGALTISGNGIVQLSNNVTTGSPVATSNVNITSLSITGNGQFDIGNNRIIINYGYGSDPIASIAAWIASGYASGTWDGTGIVSADAQANSNSYGIGYADGADPGNPAGLYRGNIEIMYTLLGDANLDGKVNGTDFNLMATNFNQMVTNGWDEGDFNYDGKVNGSDFVLLADNFNQFASQSAVSAADLAALDSFAAANKISLANVPEPASIGLIALAGFLAERRRTASPRKSAPRYSL